MRRVSIFGVTPGMYLARDIRGHAGELLLAKGVEVQPTHLYLLHQRGCLLIDVQDGITDDIDITETLSHHVRQKGLRAVESIYTVIGDAAQAMDTSREDYVSQELQGAAFAKKTRDEKPIHQLTDAAMSIVDEILDSGAALGLNTLRMWDEYTFQHSVSTAIAGTILGRELGWSRPHLCAVSVGCLMHDIGKVFIHRDIITKPGKLTDDEMELVKRHAQLGYEAVRQIFGPGVLSNHVPFQHHEKQDGTGYPRGLRGRNEVSQPSSRVPTGHILPYAELAAIADVYDALNSDRPYRPAVPPDTLAELMQRMSGQHLNAPLLDRFLRILKLFPEGSEVVLHGPVEINGCKGVVSRSGTQDRRRPRVRVLFDAYNRPLDPFEIDLWRHPELRVEATFIFTKDAMEPLPEGEAESLRKTAEASARIELAGPLICA